jgi:hypothetical protein
MDVIETKLKNFSTFITTLSHKSDNQFMMGFISTAINQFSTKMMIDFLKSNFQGKTIEDSYSTIVSQLGLRDLSDPEREKLTSYIKLFQLLVEQLPTE